MTLFIEFAKLILAGIAGALTAGFFWSFFSFRRFRKEETWKQRRDTYHVIVVGIGRIRDNAADIDDYYSTKGRIGQEKWNLGNTVSLLREITRADDYIISPTAAKALKEFIGSVDNPGSFDRTEEAANVLTTSKVGLSIIKGEAAKHLGLKLQP